MHHENHKCRSGHGAAIFSGVIFAIIAAIHLIRSFAGWPLVFDTYAVPVWATIVSGIVAALLALWNFCSCCCKKKCCDDKCNIAGHNHNNHNHNKPL